MSTRERPALTESEVVRAVQQGDSAAFKVLYDAYRDRVYNFAYYSLGDGLWAEDVLQIIFLKVYKGLREFRFESSFSTWIYRIALNECMNQQRRRKPNAVPLETILGSDDELDLGPLPDSRHHQNQREEVIHQAIIELTPKLRTVVALKYLDGLSYEEIAQVLQCAPGTIASRLSRALSQLEARLRPLKRVL